MLQQMAKDKYSIETLRELNVSYDREHWLTQDDVDMANNYVQLIERTRSEITPQVGDRVVYVTEHGDYYGHALIDHMHRDEERLSVCERPYVSFVWKEDGSIRLSVSGGACANGSVTFLARVPLWFYAEPNPKYGNYTTETYRKFYLNKRMDTEKGNLYQSFDIAFRNETDFRQFLEDYEGTVFKGNWANQIVVWCFRHENRFITQDEWNKIDEPAVERRFNFYPEQVKIVKDMEQHITYFYRIKPQNF